MKGIINFPLVNFCWLLTITVHGQIPNWSPPSVPDSPNVAWSSSQVGSRGHADRAIPQLWGAVSRGQVQQQQQHHQQHLTPPHQQFWTDQTGTQDTFSVLGSAADFGNTPHQGRSVGGSMHFRDHQSRASQQALPQDQFIIHAPSVISLQSLAPDWNLDWWYQPESNIAPTLNQQLPEFTQQTSSSSQHRVDSVPPGLQVSVGQPSQQQPTLSPVPPPTAIALHPQPSQSRIIAQSPPQPPSQPVSPPPSPSQPVPPPPPPSHPVPPPSQVQTALHPPDLSQHVPLSPVAQLLQTSHTQPRQPLVPASTVQQQQTWSQPGTWSDLSLQQPQTWTQPAAPQAAVSWTEGSPVQEPLSPAWSVGTHHISPPMSPQPLPALPVNPPTQLNNMEPPPPAPARKPPPTSHVFPDNQQKIPANYVLLGQPDGGNSASSQRNSLPPTGGEIPPLTGQFAQLASQAIPSPAAVPSAQLTSKEIPPPSAIPLTQFASEAIPPPAAIPLTQVASEAIPPPAAVPLVHLAPEVIPPPAAVPHNAILQAETSHPVTGSEIIHDNSQLPAGTRMPPVNLGQPSNTRSQINFLYTTPSQMAFLPSTNYFPQASWDAAWEHYYHDPAQFSHSGSPNQGDASQSAQNQLSSQIQLQHQPSASPDQSQRVLPQQQSPPQQSQWVQGQSLSQQLGDQQGTSSSQWNPQPQTLPQQQTASPNQWMPPSQPQPASQQVSWQQTSQQSSSQTQQQSSDQSSWQNRPQPPPQPIQQQAQWQHQPAQLHPAPQQSVWQQGQPQHTQEQHGQQHGEQQQQHWQQPQPAQQEPPADIGTVQGQGWAAVINSRPAQLQYGVTLVDGTSYTEEYSLPMSRVQQIVVKDMFDRVMSSLTIDRNSGTFSLRSKRGINLCYVGMIDQDVLDNMNAVSDSIRTSTHSYIHQINELFVYREAEQLFPRDVRAVAGDFLTRTCGHEPIIFRIVKAQNSVIVHGNVTLSGETCPFGPPLRSGFSLYSCGSSGYCPLLYTCNIQYGLCCPEMPRSTNCISLSIGQICVTYMPNRPIID